MYAAMEINKLRYPRKRKIHVYSFKIIRKQNSKENRKTQGEGMQCIAYKQHLDKMVDSLNDLFEHAPKVTSANKQPTASFPAIMKI